MRLLKATVFQLLIFSLFPAMLWAQKYVELPTGSVMLQLPDDYSVRPKGRTVLLIETGVEKSRLTFSENVVTDDLTLAEYAARAKAQMTAFAGNNSGLQFEIITDEETFPVNGLDCYRLEANVTDSRGRGVYGIAFAYKSGNRFYCLLGICHLGRDAEDFKNSVEEIAQTVEVKE